MDIRKILADLRSERDRLNQAIAAIEAISSDHSKPTAVEQRRISAAGRRRISKAAKAMWAERRKKAKPGRRSRISAAARKRLSAMLKARWASGKMGRRRTA